MMIVLFVIFSICKETIAFQPEFVESISNVSVAVGRDATFTCHVRHLGGYRVGWLKADTKAIQAIHENVITHNSRVTVSHLDQNTWNLHIKAVTEEDRGGYMCQLNTDPMKSQIGFLDVVIPPDFVAEDTSSDVIVPEGSSVKLTCRARGYPEPIVTWRREDGNEIILKDNIGTKTLVSSYRGEVLKLTKISRNEMGSYLCIASNGVPPSVSKRISLSIHFHPVIQVPNQLVGAPLGTDVQIECHVEASPKSINYWIKDTGEMIVSSGKYLVQESTKSMYETKMTMIVRKFQKDDVGSYRCIAKNSLGEVDSSIRLYEIPGPNRKNPSIKHGPNSDADANDVLKMKSPAKVNGGGSSYAITDDEDDMYSSAENYDDSEFGVQVPQTPKVYFGNGGNGNKQATHRPHANADSGGGGSNNGYAVGGHGADGRHHHTLGINAEFANVGPNGIGIGGMGGGMSAGNNVAGMNSIGSVNSAAAGMSRKTQFYGKTEVRGAIDNNELTSAGTKVTASMPCYWWHIDRHYRHLAHLPFLIVLLVPTLITTTLL